MAKTILPTGNQTWGFWGTCGHNGYDQEMAWEAASDVLATAFDLTPEQVRDLLDKLKPPAPPRPITPASAPPAKTPTGILGCSRTGIQAFF